MKRLVEIAQLPVVATCVEQQQEYQASRRLLADHNKSLSLYKVLTKEVKARILKCCEELEGLLVLKKPKSKRRSVIDYYSITLENLVEHFSQEARKVAVTLENAYLQSKEAHKKADKMLLQSRKNINQQTAYHQRLFKDYMINVYPETTSLLFRLQSDRKLVKKEDSVREAALLQQYKVYEDTLNNQIDIFHAEIRAMRETSKDRTQEIKDGFVKMFQACLPEFSGEIQQEELKSFAAKIEPKQSRSRSRSRPKQVF